MIVSCLTSLRFHAVRRVGSLALLLTFGGPLPAATVVTYSTVAVSGGPAPGTSAGVNYLDFSTPTINSTGQVVFNAIVTGTGVTAGSDEGLWVGAPGGVALLVRTGAQAAGTASGVDYADPLTTEFGEYFPLNPSGQSAFISALVGTGVTDLNAAGVFAGAPGAVALAARAGAAAPGAGAGTTYVDFDGLALNASGRVVFGATLDGNSVSDTNDAGLWSGTPGSVALVARTGSQAPGTGAGTVYDFMDVPSINASGQIAFAGSLIGTGVTAANETGIWVGAPGALALVARGGTQAPGTAAGVKFRAVTGGFFAITINSTGQTVFSASLTGTGVTAANDSGIWIGAAGSIAKLARTGDQAPGLPAGAVYSAFSFDLPINESGQSAFFATVTGAGFTTANNSGLWAGLPGSLQKIVMQGDAAPGTSAGTIFGPFLEEDANVTPALNDKREIIFENYLTGTGVTIANDHSLWFSDATGVLSLVLRDGNAFEVAPGDFRTVSTFFYFDGSGTANGLGSAFNNQGQIAFYAEFTDTSSGIFIAVPEPTGLTLTALGCGLLAVGRRRRFKKNL